MQRIYIQLTNADIPYLGLLKPLLQGRANVTVNTGDFVTGMEVALRATAAGCNLIATTSYKLLTSLVSMDRSVSLDDFSGSIIKKYNKEFLILNPLEHLVTVDYGRFLYERYFSKFLRPENWLQLPMFSWELFVPANKERLEKQAKEATFISVDIETIIGDADKAISCVGFSIVHLCNRTKSFNITTVVVPLDELYNLYFARKICQSTAPKVLQNGKYDIAYLLRYNSQPTNYLFDTANLFHAWYSELPKRLDFITSFVLRDWEYWKDSNDSWGSLRHYEYNARDCYATACALVALLKEMPSWALSNYIAEFKVVHPCILVEATGFKKDMVAASKIEQQIEKSMSGELEQIRTMIGNRNFNPSSPKQVQQLFDILGSGDIKGTTPPNMDKVSSRHPLNSLILGRITSYRKDRKLLTSYMKPEGSWHGRILYALNPHGTDTSRFASKESQFWNGLQIQNIPRDRDDVQIKEMFIADEGFYIGEGDYSQNEAKGTAYISGDLNLLRAVNDPTRDFHSHNASAFFGLQYEDICSSTCTFNKVTKKEKWRHSRLRKDIIDIAKRTNHGANYNMQEYMLLDTMGIKNVLMAKKLLQLPQSWPPKRVTKHLLQQFDTTYPVVRGASYDKIFNDVNSTKLLVGPTGWTRYCFSDTSSKRARNKYAAHPPQSLGAQLLNRAFIRIFYEVWLEEPENFKLLGQIHDSIPFQYRIGHDYLCIAVKEIMEECSVVEVTDTFGIKREMRVNVDLKGNSVRWSQVEKMEFE